MYKHVHTVVQTVGISRNQSESVGISRKPGSGGCGGGVLVAALTEHLQHQIHRGRCRRVALCTLWISVDLLWFFLWTPRPHAWTISFNCRKLSSQLRLGPSIDIDMKKNTVKNTRIKGVFEANLFLHTRSQRVKEHWVLPSG